MRETVIILPSRRSGRLLLKELARHIGRPFFAPEIVTIDDFIESLSRKKKLPEQELLIRLFSVYRGLDHAREKTFHSFSSWGHTFLQDINDIDMQLADAGAIFGNLKELKELETSFGKEKLTANQEKYIRFYSILKELYFRFNQLLEEENAGYEGNIYRYVAQNRERLVSECSYRRYIFAGLGALSPAEVAIINHFISHLQGEIYFDFDTFYMDSISSFCKNLEENMAIPALQWINDDYASIPKNITEAGVSGKITQIFYAIEKIKQIKSEQGHLRDTAVVLADESLLIPFIHAYDCSNANLTMGYPLTETPAYHLLRSIIETSKNSYRFKEIQQNDELLFYHKDLISLLQNPVLKEYFFTEEPYNEISDQINRSNKVFYKSGEFPENLKKMIPLPLPQGREFLKKIIDYFRFLLSDGKSNPSFEPSLQLLLQGLEEVDAPLAIMEERDLEFQTLEYFIQQKMESISIPLEGSHHDELQVMGLLETRALDFKNIIMLSVNEGILPSGKKQSSLILYDVKRHFHLPTYQQKNRVYAYHFFRLLQRAQNIFLVYDQDSSDTLAEKSRFIGQLEFEIKHQKLENTISFRKEEAALLPLDNIRQKEIRIPKNENLTDRLKEMSYSPSSISCYITCPLKFYFSYLEKIKAPKTITENVEQRVIGTILHTILEAIFTKIMNNPDRFPAIIGEELSQLENTVDYHFSTHEDLQGQDREKGKLFLYSEVVKRNLEHYLHSVKSEMEKRPFRILGTEIPLRSKMSEKGREIHFYGIADRIDYRDGRMAIIDYKTGRVERKELEFQDMETLFREPAQSKLFQLLMYGYLYRKSGIDLGIPDTEDILCGIVSFRELHKNPEQNFIVPKLPGPGGKVTSALSSDLLDEFEVYLYRLIEDIVNPAVPFSQTEDAELCKFCDYLPVCGK